MRIEPSRLAGIPGATSEVVFGDLVEELTRFSASVDLLAIGSRSHGPLGRLIDGSVSHALLRRSHCPLLVLPRGSARQGLARLTCHLEIFARPQH
jgi:nucleotide-binding universal stress UspA family protein